tara:strand:- start:2984 stop:3352 length:369 start_codon:yes stop_codon:yes gene_type:complete
MGNYQKSKGRTKGHNFVMLRHDMMDSPAWHSLSPNARCVWTEIMRRYNGTNNGKIPLSCREAAKFCKISKATASRAFKELEEKGFIKIAVFAGFKNKHRVSNHWIVTHERYDNKPPTNEWKN